MILISKKEAIHRQLKRYFTGVPCVRGHVCERRINGNCVDCKSTHDKTYNNKNKERISNYQKTWRTENKEDIKIYQSTYYQENKESLILKSKEYKTNNKEYIKTKATEYRDKYQYKLNSLSAKRHSDKKTKNSKLVD